MGAGAGYVKRAGCALCAGSRVAGRAPGAPERGQGRRLGANPLPGGKQPEGAPGRSAAGCADRRPRRRRRGGSAASNSPAQSRKSGSDCSVGNCAAVMPWRASRCIGRRAWSSLASPCGRRCSSQCTASAAAAASACARTEQAAPRAATASASGSQRGDRFARCRRGRGGSGSNSSKRAAQRGPGRVQADAAPGRADGAACPAPADQFLGPPGGLDPGHAGIAQLEQ